jgi:hypothetical protein
MSRQLLGFGFKAVNRLRWPAAGVSHLFLLALIAGLGGCSSSAGPSSDSSTVDTGTVDTASEHPGTNDASAGEDSRRDSTADTGAAPMDGASDVGAGDATEAQPLGACLGVCLETFTSACPKVVGCTTSMANGKTNICYANGVKEQRTIDGNMTDGTVKKADGSVCYRWTRTSATQNYLDLAGTTVAEVMNGATNNLYVVTCGAGGPRQIDLSSDECSATRAVALQTCTPGDCTF